MKTKYLAYTLQDLGIFEFVIRDEEINSEEEFKQNVIEVINGNEVPVTINYNTVVNQYDVTVANEKLKDLRKERNKLLAETDWTQQPDILEETQAKWRPYRQALRDITENYSSLDDVEWPTKPE